MIGSEKQIIWATELKVAVTETIKEFTAYATKIGAPAEVIATWTARVDKLAACDIAGAIIDQFQGFSRTGDLQKDAVSLNSKYKVGSNQYGYKFS
mgnify:CR=1 FL=1